MNIKDEAVEAAAEAIKNGRPFRHAETARAALTAALPHMADTPCDHICMGECATDDCENCGIHHFEVGGVGSYYCGSCLKKIAAIASHEPAPEPAKDGPEVVGYLVQHPKEGKDFQWAPLTTGDKDNGYSDAALVRLSDYQALQAEIERLRIERITAERDAADYMNRLNKAAGKLSIAENVIAELAAIVEEFVTKFSNTTFSVNDPIWALFKRARAALKGQSNEA